jgi:hypothetical protein
MSVRMLGLEKSNTFSKSFILGGFGVKTCRRIIIWVIIEHGNAEFTRSVKCVLWTLTSLG